MDSKHMSPLHTLTLKTDWLTAVEAAFPFPIVRTRIGIGISNKSSSDRLFEQRKNLLLSLLLLQVSLSSSKAVCSILSANYLDDGLLFEGQVVGKGQRIELVLTTTIGWLASILLGNFSLAHSNQGGQVSIAKKRSVGTRLASAIVWRPV